MNLSEMKQLVDEAYPSNQRCMQWKTKQSEKLATKVFYLGKCATRVARRYKFATRAPRRFAEHVRKHNLRARFWLSLAACAAIHSWLALRLLISADHHYDQCHSRLMAICLAIGPSDAKEKPRILDFDLLVIPWKFGDQKCK